MLINVAITGFYYDAVKKAVMHNRYLAKTMF
jgi:hypothetical protein